MPFTLLVANRGEIAIRILGAAAELGMQTAAIYADEQDKSHCAFADVSVKLKNAASFLDPQQVIDAAKSVQAMAIHPGYGFLSESMEFAETCSQAGILFVGPSVSCISAVGDKVSARQVAKAAGVPVIPGTEQSVSDPAQVMTFANTFGYPIMLKARDGGGGRGIRMVHSESDVAEALQRCINESPSKQIFIEKAIVGAKHIEVQILGDRHGNLIHLLERDCSAQRRYQKIVEVAPCPALNDKLRSDIHNAAIKLGRYIKYDSAGTVEFLVKPDTNEFYFLEVNPRIQVEHTITEQITQVDLVQSQIRIANGESLNQLGLSQSTVHNPRLVSIQARIVAENPANNNMLSVGKITAASFPHGQGIRIDTWIRPGCVVLPSFDSLLAKVIVTGQSFSDAVAKLKNALQRTHILGVDTNIDFVLALITNAHFTGGVMERLHIETLEEEMERLIQESASIAKNRRRLHDVSATVDVTKNNASAAPTSLTFKPGDAFNVEVSDPNDKTNTATVHTLQIGKISTNNFPDEFVGEIQSASNSLPYNPLAISVTRKSAISGMRRKASARAPSEIATPITGIVVELNVKEGETVETGQQLFVMSAMKMETVVRATAGGRVDKVYAKVNDLVEAGDLIVELVKESKL